MEIPWNSICKFIGILLEIIWNFYCKKTNRNLRHLLVESAKSIKRATALSHGQKSRRLLVRQDGMPSEIINYADKAASRIKSRMRKLECRGMNYNKAAVACARELACFAWGMMTGHVS